MTKVRDKASMRFAVLPLAICGLAGLGIANAQENSAAKLLSVAVELGDVSLTKLPFITAADNGIYERAGLKVDQFITPSDGHVPSVTPLSRYRF